jgi:hypothetical protein
MSVCSSLFGSTRTSFLVLGYQVVVKGVMRAIGSVVEAIPKRRGLKQDITEVGTASQPRRGNKLTSETSETSTGSPLFLGVTH